MLKSIAARLRSLITGDSIKRVVRTFGITVVVLFVPGLLGWINDVTDWAKGQGSTPFPDAHGLAYLGVSAITAAFVAAGNLVLNAIEDATGKGILRTPTTALATAPKRAAKKTPKRNEQGSVTLLSFTWPVTSFSPRRSDPETTSFTRLWHGSYCRWYDHDRARHRQRARVWGWIADRLVNVGDVIGWH